MDCDGRSERVVRSVAWATTTVCPLASALTESQTVSSAAEALDRAPEAYEEARSECCKAARAGFRASQGSISARRDHGGSWEPSGQTQNSVGHFGRARRDLTDNQGSSLEGRSPRAGTPHFRADQELSVVLGSEAKASQDTVQAKEALSKVLAVKEEQETLLEEGERRLVALQETEKAMSSQFIASITYGVSTGSGRVQPIVRSSTVCRGSWRFFVV